MTKEDLKAGRCYRAKKPRNVRGFYNDRQVKRLTETQVQYDGPAVAWGRKYPLVSIEKFLAWASHDVTDDLPPGEWQDFHDWANQHPTVRWSCTGTPPPRTPPRRRPADGTPWARRYHPARANHWGHDTHSHPPRHCAPSFTPLHRPRHRGRAHPIPNPLMADNATEAAARSPHGWLRGRPEGQHAAASHLRPHSGGAAPRTHTETMSITFDTDPRHIMERVAGKGSHVPLVVWLPRERLPEQFQ